LKAATNPAKSVTSLASSTEYGVVPRRTVNVSGVTSKSKRDGAALAVSVEAVPALGGMAGEYGVYECTT